MIGDEETKQCIVIDPIRHVSQFLMIAETFDLVITQILETHVHADFVSGSKELKYQLGNKPTICCSGMGGEAWIPSYADRIIKDQDEVRVGSVRLVALATPGHTPEHLMWICYDETRSQTTPWFVFSGDCLFAGSVGRPDLLGADELDSLSQQLYQSLFSTLSAFPDFLEVLPAHSAGSLCGKALSGYSSSTLGYERQFNPYLAALPQKEWEQRLMQGLGPFPPYFKKMKEINVQGPPLLNTLETVSITDEELLGRSELVLVDVRLPEQYSQYHFPGTINIPFTSSFIYWAGWLLPIKSSVALILPDDKNIYRIAEQLRLIGFDETIFTYIWDEKKLGGKPYDSFSLISVADLIERQKGGAEETFVLDVRTTSEWDQGHIPDAHHYELNTLYDKMHEIPEDVFIATVCRSGYRGSTAASLLKKYGFTNVANVKGGFQAWKQAALPIVN